MRRYPSRDFTIRYPKVSIEDVRGNTSTALTGTVAAAVKQVAKNLGVGNPTPSWGGEHGQGIGCDKVV